MKTNDMFYIIRKNILTKDNIVVFISTILLLISIFACITTSSIAITLKNTQLEHSSGRTILISSPKSDEDINKIKNIKHITALASQKYANIAVVDIEYENHTGNLYLKPLLESNEVSIIHGKNITNPSEIICPYNSIIGSNYDLINEDNIEEYIKNGKELIGKSLYIKGINEDLHRFSIVGTTKNIPMDDIGTCYVSISDFDLFKSNIDVCSDDDCYEYSMYMVRVDKYKNMEYVENELKSIGYTSFRMLTLDEGIINRLTKIPLFICSIILVICLTLSYSFYRKKSHTNEAKYSILKAIGYNKKNIVKIESTEAVLTTLVSIILSFIIFGLIFIIAKKYFFKNLLLYNLTISLPIGYIVVFSLAFILYIIVITKYLTKKRIRKQVRDLQSEE